jgi:hypothetical protein
MEDCEWMYSGCLGQGQVTDEWIDKTDAFLERAFGEAAKGAAFDDAWCTTLSRQPQPQRIRRSMGTRIYLFNLTLNYA